MLAAILYIPLLQCISDIRIQDDESGLTQEKSLRSAYYLGGNVDGENFITKILTYDIKSHNAEDSSKKNLVKILIKDKTYLLEDAVFDYIKGLTNEDYFVLKDETKISRKSKHLSLMLVDNKSVKIHGADKVSDDGETLVFDFKSGEKIEILNTKLYKEEEKGVYIVNPDKIGLNNPRMSESIGSGSIYFGECPIS